MKWNPLSCTSLVVIWAIVPGVNLLPLWKTQFGDGTSWKTRKSKNLFMCIFASTHVIFV